MHYWLCAAKVWEGAWDGAKELNRKVVERGPESFIERTRAWWKLWVGKEPTEFFGLPPSLIDLYKRSLLIIATQIDEGGGIIAANDSDIMHFARDTYSYVWPRDGALVAHALDMAGYPQKSLKFFHFCADVITRDGYLLHKYNPDKSLASSWHPWVALATAATGNQADLKLGRPQLPIQEDETALVVWAMWRHFQRYRDIDAMKPLYGRLIRKAADFMVRYRERHTGLPAPSYDLWEERRGILTFTCAAVYGGLVAAAEFAHAFGDIEPAERYARAAREIRAGIDRHLWRPELGRFARMINVDDDGAVTVDPTIDASLYGAFAFGAYAPDDRARGGDDEGGARAAVVQDRGRRRGALRERLLPRGVERRRQRAGQPVVHLHDVAGAARRAQGQDGRGAARGGRDPRVGRLAQAAVGRPGRAGAPVHQRADVGVAADVEPRHRRRRRAVVSREARSGRALPDLRWAASGARSKATSEANPICCIATEVDMDEMANPLREGLQGERIPAPTTMVIFGASGDLTKRKLVPALYSLARDRLLPPVFNVVGVARRDMAHGVFRQAMRESTDKYARRRPVEDGLWQTFSDGIFYVNGTFEDPATYERLKKALADIDRERDTGGNRVFYLSTPPSEYPIIVKQLGAAGLINKRRPRPVHPRHHREAVRSRSRERRARSTARCTRCLREDQTYRIDHYLGKETVQNILVFRFANGIWEPLWNGRYIDHVQLTVAESIGVEGRGGYFEQAGIVRDMVQNHMFQFLCLSAMEPPVAFEAEAVRDEKLKVLQSLRPLPTEPKEVERLVVRGQYGGGFVNGQAVMPATATSRASPRTPPSRPTSP